jgi:hypothetical protein
MVDKVGLELINIILTLPASGSAGGGTGRQEWLISRISFLEPYIRKRASLSNVDEKVFI